MSKKIYVKVFKTMDEINDYDWIGCDIINIESVLKDVRINAERALTDVRQQSSHTSKEEVYRVYFYFTPKTKPD